MVQCIIFDNSVIDCLALEERLKTICSSVFKNGSNQFFVNYNGSCKSLYDNLAVVVEGKNVLMIAIKDDYWGYQNRELWDWIKLNL